MPSAVSLHRGSGTLPSGVFHCEISGASGTSQNIYVGIYPQGVGEDMQCTIKIILTCTIIILWTGNLYLYISYRFSFSPVYCI